MGLFDALTKSVGKKLSSEGVTKLEKGMVKLIGSIEGRKKEEVKRAPNPKIFAVTWGDKKTGKEIQVGKYGKEVELHIDTENAMGCWLLISVHCEDWENPYKEEIVQIIDPNNSVLPIPEKTRYTFKPQVSWLKRGIDSDGSKMIAEVYLLYALPSNYSFHSNFLDQFYAKELAAHLRGEKKEYAISNFSLVKEYDKKKSKEIEISKIVIVIDPGHGVKPAQNESGSQARMYKYKIMEKDHNGNLIDTKKQMQNYVTVDKLPQYVLDDPKTYIVAKTPDDGRCEYQLSFDIAEFMISMLKSEGYTVINTRKTRAYWETGKNKEYAITYRWKMANDNKADYFISLHADGAAASQDIDTTRGAHVVYNNGDNIGKSFAKDLFKYYTVIPKVSKHPSPRTDVGVVGNSNKTKYKALIEFGFMAQPKDSHIMHTQQPLIARQIVKALIEHINQKFE
jgi:N-acetylmuramoyl-L-alanine amidase